MKALEETEKRRKTAVPTMAMTPVFQGDQRDVLPFVATIWFWLRFLGTPGKMLVKIKIVDANTGNKMSVGQAIGRYFAYIISSIPFGLGFIWIAFDKKKQGWHDKLAGTVVIK